MNRIELWQKIQREQPEIAQVLVEVRRVYMDAIPKIMIDDRRVYHPPTPTIKLGGEVAWSPALKLRGERHDQKSR